MAAAAWAGPLAHAQSLPFHSLYWTTAKSSSPRGPLGSKRPPPPWGYPSSPKPAFASLNCCSLTRAGSVSVPPFPKYQGDLLTPWALTQLSWDQQHFSHTEARKGHCWNHTTQNQSMNSASTAPPITGRKQRPRDGESLSQGHTAYWLVISPALRTGHRVLLFLRTDVMAGRQGNGRIAGKDGLT